MSKAGSLTVVGTGFLVAGQVTPEALAAIHQAERFFHLVAEPVTRHWLAAQHARAEPLHDVFWEGRPRRPAYEEIVERLLAAVRTGARVCAAFYGHPGVFVYPAHEAVRRARSEGFAAAMLPGVSAEDCLFADLEIDPAADGCQSFEATDFLVRERRFDPRSGLVLWQIGGLGIATYHLRELWNRDGLDYLVEVLARSYPRDHRVVVYETMQYPMCPPLIQPCPLAELPLGRVNTHSTLWVPPLGRPALDEAMLARVRATRQAR